jgi:hypothetical protein
MPNIPPYVPNGPLWDLRVKPGQPGYGKPTQTWWQFFDRVRNILSTLVVSATGGISGNGLPGTPLTVLVDNVTIGINGSNQLYVISPSAIPIHWAFNNSLTNAQFKALPTTAQQIIAAPGVGKVLMPWWGYLQFNAGSGAYTNVNASSDCGVLVAFGDFSTNALTTGQIWTGGSYRSLLVPYHDIPDANALLFGYLDRADVPLEENTPLKLVAWNPLGNYTGGNNANTFRVGIAYSILDYDLGTFV